MVCMWLMVVLNAALNNLHCDFDVSRFECENAGLINSSVHIKIIQISPSLDKKKKVELISVP